MDQAASARHHSASRSLPRLRLRARRSSCSSQRHTDLSNWPPFLNPWLLLSRSASQSPCAGGVIPAPPSSPTTPGRHSSELSRPGFSLGGSTQIPKALSSQAGNCASSSGSRSASRSSSGVLSVLGQFSCHSQTLDLAPERVRDFISVNLRPQNTKRIGGINV